MRGKPFRLVERGRSDLGGNWVCPRASPLAGRQASEGEEAVTGFLQAVSNRAMTQPPLADEGLATVFDVGRRGGVDHVGVIGGHLVVQALGRVGEQVPMLMHRTSLYRDAIPNGGHCLLQSPGAVPNKEL